MSGQRHDPGRGGAARGTGQVRVIVCGSRGWNDRKLIADTLNELVLARGWRFPEPTIVHGAARGVDRLAADEAGKAGMLVEAHPADWEARGKAAGPVRNEEMAALGADLCLAFWDGRSVGTLDMIERARRHGIPVEIIAPAPYAGPGSAPVPKSGRAATPENTATQGTA